MKAALHPGYVLAILAIVLGVLGLVVGAKTLFERADLADALRASGVPVTATVVDQKTNASRQSTQHLYKVRYTHDTFYAGWVDCGYHPCPEIGATVRIWIDPADPRRFVDEDGRIDLDEPTGRAGIPPLLFGAILALGGLAGYVSLVLKGRRTR